MYEILAEILPAASLGFKMLLTFSLIISIVYPVWPILNTKSTFILFKI